MGRYADIEKISDGKIYGENDMVKADTCGCEGCNGACCKGMGESIVLDPYDVHRLCLYLGVTVEKLLETVAEFNYSDGIILPNIRMNEKNGGCAFLDDNSRCTVHEARPGVCRLFPLGRAWLSEDRFGYILQKNECERAGLTKIKVKKWLDIEDIGKYNEYIIAWHRYITKIRQTVAQIGSAGGDNTDTQIKTICMYTLKNFYMMPYESGDFYSEIIERIEKAFSDMGMD